MPEDNKKRFRFSVPIEDESVIKWVERQDNISISLRMLIGDVIEKYGYTDYSCRPREQKTDSSHVQNPVQYSQVAQIGPKQDITQVTSSPSDKPRSVRKEVVSQPKSDTGRVTSRPAVVVDDSKDTIVEKSVNRAKPVSVPMSAQSAVSSSVSDDDIFSMFNGN